jgi:hypothetical protein
MGTAKRETHSIYLERASSYEYKVSPEGYAAILEILRTKAVCAQCGDYYSPHNPQIAGLLCLSCFLSRNTHLQYQGLLDPAMQGLGQGRYASAHREQFMFLDKAGHLHTTEAGAGASESATENIAMTLFYWHFPRPQEARKNGKPVELSDIGWHIYGDVRGDEIILLQYGSKWYGNEALFLVRRGGPAIQVSMRRPVHRALLEQARAELEATYREEPEKGYYFEGGHHFYVSEENIYRRVARRVNERGQAMQAGEEESSEETEGGEGQQPEP